MSDGPSLPESLLKILMIKGSDDSDDDLDGVPLERRDTASELDMKAAEERRQILR